MIFLPRDVTPWLLYRNWKIVGTKIISFLSRRFGCNLWTVLQHTVLKGGSFGKLCAVPGIGFVLVLYFLQRGFNEARVYVRLSALQFLVKDRDMLGYEIYIYFFCFWLYKPVFCLGTQDNLKNFNLWNEQRYDKS